MRRTFADYVEESKAGGCETGKCCRWNVLALNSIGITGCFTYSDMLPIPRLLPYLSYLHSRFSNWFVIWLAFAFSMAAHGQTSEPKKSLLDLEQMSDSVQELSARVSLSVVRILVTHYAGVDSSGNGQMDVPVGRQQSIGSGVIIDPDGYIVTNAHVVSGAEKIRVDVTPKGAQSIASVISQSNAQPVDASLVGVFKEGDLAVLKIPGKGYPALPLADYGKLRQGQIVFAYGSPSGLQNSVSMGLVSSIARQPDIDSPFLYIQTDTPINPGNSGGPLVNIAGEVVGLNTFILSRSGGNEGVGFAIPSMLLQWVVPQLRKHGHVHRESIGIGLQAITPVLAKALKLSEQSGVVISDVQPGSPAEGAGIKVGDVIRAVNSRKVDSVPAMLGSYFDIRSGKSMHVDILRGAEHLSFDVQPIEETHSADRLTDLADPARDLIPSLGILGVSLDQRVAELASHLRLPTGVVVASRVQTAQSADTALQPGDAIYAVNGNFIHNVNDLKAALAKFKTDDAVALLVERDSSLQFISFQQP
jgi:serine protease Do